MGRHRLTREGNYSLCIRALPKENLILTHYMLSAWWLYLLDRLGHYVIHPGAIAQIIMISNNIMTLGYTYAKRRLKKPLDIFCQIEHISRLMAWIPSILSWTPTLRGREQYLLRPSFPKAFTGTNNQDFLTVFDTYTQYMLWDSRCTHSIHT